MNHLAIVISCIDYRFWPQAIPLLKQKYGEFDLIQMAGSSKNLTLPSKKEYRITILENIKISIQLHNSQKIILTNHIDCGAYGGSKNFKSQKEEIEFHKMELKRAEKIIQKEFPQLLIKKELLTIDINKKVKLY